MGFHLESGGERIRPQLAFVEPSDTINPEWANVLLAEEIDSLSDAMWAALETSEALGQEPVHVVDENSESHALIESRSDVRQAQRTREWLAKYGECVV